MTTRQARRLFAAALMFCAALPVWAASDISVEHQKMAGLLFKFSKFVEWPAAAFASKNAPFCIGILGSDPFGRVLDEIVEGQTTGGRKIEIKRSQKAEDLRGCQIVFINKSEEKNIEGHLAALASTPALTVSAFYGFATQYGGIVNFVVEEQEKKIRFRVNVDALNRKNLKMSAQMMNFAIVVHDETEKKGEQP